MELFLSWAAGDATFDSNNPVDRDRYPGNGAVNFGWHCCIWPEGAVGG